MYFAKLSEKDKRIVLQCMNAISKGNFLSGEFQTRLGIDEQNLMHILRHRRQVEKFLFAAIGSGK